MTAGISPSSIAPMMRFRTDDYHNVVSVIAPVRYPPNPGTRSRYAERSTAIVFPIPHSNVRPVRSPAKATVSKGVAQFTSPLNHQWAPDQCRDSPRLARPRPAPNPVRDARRRRWSGPCDGRAACRSSRDSRSERGLSTQSCAIDPRVRWRESIFRNPPISPQSRHSDGAACPLGGEASHSWPGEPQSPDSPHTPGETHYLETRPLPICWQPTLPPSTNETQKSLARRHVFRFACGTIRDVCVR